MFCVISTYQYQNYTLAPLSLYDFEQSFLPLYRDTNVCTFSFFISDSQNLFKLLFYLFWLYSSLKQTLLISLISNNFVNPWTLHLLSLLTIKTYKSLVLFSQYGSILWWTIIPQFMLKQASLASCHQCIFGLKPSFYLWNF